jgi:mannosyltransferase
MLWKLGTPSLWQDEAATIGAANRPLPSLLSLVTNIDAVHGLYYTLIHFWGGLFGFDPFSLRVPSVIAVGLSAYLLYLLVRRLGLSETTAAWSAIFFLALPRTHMSGSEARSNSLTATLAIALTLAFVIAINDSDVVPLKATKKSNSDVLQAKSKLKPMREPRRARWSRFLPWVLFTGLATISIYLFMFSALILAAYGTYLLISRRNRLIPFLASAGVALVLAAPVYYFGFREKSQVGWITRKPLLQYLWEALIGVDYNRALPMAALGLVLCVFALASRAGLANRSILLVALWAMLPSALLITVSILWQPYFVDHYVTFTSGGTAILMAIGLTNINLLRTSAVQGPKKSPSWLITAVGLLVVALCLPSFVASREPGAKGTQWAQISTAIRQNSQAGDGILLPDAVSKESRALDLMIVAYAPEFAGRIDLTLKVAPEQSRRLFGKRVRERDAPEPTSSRVLLVTDPADKQSVLVNAPAWLMRDFKFDHAIKFETAQISVFNRLR